jgi:hypothetical protein
MFATRLAHIESMSFRLGRKATDQSALRVAVTSLDGGELDRIVYFSNDEEDRILKIEKQIDWFLGHNKRLGLVAAARAFWRALEEKEVVNDEIGASRS